MTALRQRMIEDLRLRNFAEGTVRGYVQRVAAFARFHGRSPQELSLEDVRAYLLHLVQDRKVSWSHYNATVCALRFLYRVTLGQDWRIEHIPYGKRPKKLPPVLSREEVIRLLECVSNSTYRMLLLTVYAAGLRISEARRLHVADIDSQRMLIHVRQAKGHKDRMAPLSPVLLAALRAYWQTARPRGFLFPGRDTEQLIRPATINRACRAAAEAAGLHKRVTVHTLRHCFATHLLEAGANIALIQKLLGHAQLRTTTLYTHVSLGQIQSATSPADQLAQEIARLWRLPSEAGSK